ncbi:MAG TPA: hypothetical protein VGI14_20455 [Casimicrobiaceae bacterium]
MNTRIRWTAVSMLCACLAANGALAQQYVYPAKGQGKEQQKKDEGECAQWATQQSGYNPASPPPATGSGKPQTATGTDVGAGARGAARGAVVGGMMGDAGAGAAAGAAAARGQSRRTNRNEAQQASAQQGAAQQSYLKARAACLEGRGYTVK